METIDHFEERGLEITGEEAYALLSMCILSPLSLDGVAEEALFKLAEFCAQSSWSDSFLIAQTC